MKKNMRRMSALLLAAALLFGFAACKSQEKLEAPSENPADLPTDAMIEEVSDAPVPTSEAVTENEAEAPIELAPPTEPAPDNLAARYAPTPNFKMEFQMAKEGGGVEMVAYQSVALENMPEGYISTVYRVDKPSDFRHYLFDGEGLRIVTDLDFVDAKLALPASMEAGFVWDENQLMRVEPNTEMSIGVNVNSASVLVSGEENDQTKVYSEGLGLVAQWNDASAEGTPELKLSGMEKIDATTAREGFRMAQ